MKKFQQKSTLRTILSSKPVIAVIFIFSLLLISSTYDLYKKKRRVVELRDQAKRELHLMEQKTSLLDTDIEDIDSPHGKEKLIRQKYNVKKEGEGVIVVAEADIQDAVPVVKKGLFDSITDMLSKLFD